MNRVDELEIELLRPNEAAFGTAGAGGFIDVDDDLPPDAFDEEPRPRWTMAVAGLLVTGLLAGGIIAAAPWAGDETATPPATTSPPSTTTTTPTPRTTVPRDPLAGIATEPAGWVAQLPEGWQFAGAYSSGDMSFGPSGEQVDVFADRGADRATDPWLVVHGMLYNQGQLAEAATRVQFGDRPAIVQQTADDTTRVVVLLGEQAGSVSIDSHGIGLDQLSALAAGVAIDPTTGALHYGDLRTRDGVFGLPLRSSTTPVYSGVGLLGQPSASTSYGDGNSTWLEISQRPLDPSIVENLPLVLQPIEIGPEFGPVMSVLAGLGRDVRAYASPDQPGTTIVVWQEGDVLLSVAGYNAALGDLLAAASSATPATAGMWIEMLTETQQGISLNAQVEEPSAFLRGELEDGTVWQANLADGWFWINTDSAGWYGTFGELQVPVVHPFVGVDMTAWVAVDPSGTATTMRFTMPGAEPVIVPMEHLGDATAAMYLRSVDTTAQIDLLDAAGAVVFGTAA